MKLTLQQLEPRTLLAAGGMEILTFVHTDNICHPGGELHEPLQCGPHQVYDTYFTSGEVESCVDADCHSSFGTVKTNDLEADIILHHESNPDPAGLRQHIAISAGGTALQCTPAGEGEICEVIQGRINWPIAMAS